MKKIKKYYLSICIPIFNMENFISRALISIIKQSFQYFEIILVNDNSNDNTLNIINSFQSKDSRFRIINHSKNLGVYASRRDAILNSIGQYVLILDPDDMLLNKEIFQALYNYNQEYNLDIIEFLVYHIKEGSDKLIIPKWHKLIHDHNYKKKIIYQPELSELIFKYPNTNKYSTIICRTIWNKLIRKEIMLKSIQYVEKYFQNQFLIVADDTPLNIMSFNYASNFSNIKIPGYLYNLRNNSMSRGNVSQKFNIIKGFNFLLYYKFLFGYVKDFKKDLNYFFIDLKNLGYNLFIFKDFNQTKYINYTFTFFDKITTDSSVSEYIKIYIREMKNNFTNNFNSSISL
jgi:glycosyltransferase involved in cell wall biosynthesis